MGKFSKCSDCYTTHLPEAHDVTMPDQAPHTICEWRGCSDEATVTTSTETTADGVIRLCQEHFEELAI